VCPHLVLESSHLLDYTTFRIMKKLNAGRKGLSRCRHWPRVAGARRIAHGAGFCRARSFRLLGPALEPLWRHLNEVSSNKLIKLGLVVR
jgi:hypothetical protein